MLAEMLDMPAGALVRYLAFIAALVLLVGSVVLRATTNSEWELKLSDVGIALVPIVVWLVMTGQLKELKFGSEGFTAQFREAVATSIKGSVDKLPVQNLIGDEKGGLPELPKLIAKRDQFIFFVLGKRGFYDPGLAQDYLRNLTAYPFFRFVELRQNGGALFSLIDARQLNQYLGAQSDWQRFIKAIEDVDQSFLAALPGSLGASSAVAETSTKSQVLEKMEELHVDWLPVTSSDGSLAGVVERSAVLAGLVLELNKRLAPAVSP